MAKKADIPETFTKGMRTAFDERAKRHFSITEKWDTFSFYKRISRVIPVGDEPIVLLDIGVGTGHELADIFARRPNARVVGVDASAAMLEQLTRNYPDHQDKLTLVNHSVFDFDFPVQEFDGVLSLATMHHFSVAQRGRLYASIRKSLKPRGFYLEADKFVSPPVELLLQREHREALRDRRPGDENILHLVEHRDIPISLRHARRLLATAGFADISVVDEEPDRSLAIVVARAGEEGTEQPSSNSAK